MEKMHLMLAATIVGLFALESCKKKDSKTDPNDTSNPANQSTGLIYCTANNKNWSSNLPSKKFVCHYQDSFFAFDETIYGTSGEIFGDTLTLRGANVVGTDSSQIMLELVLTSAQVGSYTIGSYPARKAGTAFALYYEKLGLTAAKLCKTGYNPTGTINITNFTDSTSLVSGNFNITMNPKNGNDPKTPKYTVVKGNFKDVVFRP